MGLTRKQLHEPVEVVVRQLAVELLDVAGKAFERLGDPEDPEALHDFRVALRRLVTCFGAYRPYLPRRLAKGVRADLRRLIADTNAGRDDQVHVDWIHRQLKNDRLPKVVQQGLRAMLVELDDSPWLQTRESLIEVTSGFESIRRKLDKRFSQTTQSVQLDASGRSRGFGVSTAPIVVEHGQALRSHLESIDAPHRQKRAHRARLSAKRLRYLLEPLRPVLVGGRDAVNRLRQLQDALGDLRDLHLLEVRTARLVKRSGRLWARDMIRAARHETRVAAISGEDSQILSGQALAAALQRITAAQGRVYQAFVARWQAGNEHGFFERLDRLVDQLAPESAGRSKTPDDLTNIPPPPHGIASSG